MENNAQIKYYLYFINFMYDSNYISQQNGSKIQITVGYRNQVVVCFNAD